MKNMPKNKKKLSSYQIVIISFLILIFTGTILLMLPIAAKNGKGLSFVNAFFTAASSVCVTGLTVVDTGEYFTVFGQTIIIFLVQFGALGLMTFATILMVAFGRDVNYTERLLMKDALNQGDVSGIIRLTINLFKLTFLVEFIAGTLFAFKFYPEYGIKGIYYGYWHAISAFCNAGFDLFGKGKSLTSYVSDPFINISFAILIILGGIGFNVILDVYRKRKFSRLNLHSKVVLSANAILLVAGMLFFMLFEYGNMETLGSLSFENKLMASFFQSVSVRTAGFNTVSILDLNPQTALLMIVLMLIGASPSSTGGGLKTTTFAVIIMAAWSVIRGKSDTVLFKRRISDEIVNRSFTIATIYILVMVFGCFVIMALETFSFFHIVFEVAATFSTTGLSCEIVSSMSDISKIFLVFIMFIGRVGPLTLALALMLRSDHGLVKYPEDNIIVG